MPPCPRADLMKGIILAGGSGTRLWPVSRESFPKQFWPLISDRSMIQETASRAVGDGFGPPIVVCNQEHRFLSFLTVPFQTIFCESLSCRGKDCFGTMTSSCH